MQEEAPQLQAPALALKFPSVLGESKTAKIRIGGYGVERTTHLRAVDSRLEAHTQGKDSSEEDV